MYLADLRSSLLRRWYGVVIGVIGTLAGCWAVAGAVGPDYESRASVVLVPGTGTVAEGGNPLLYLGGLTQARDVLVGSLRSEDVLISLRERNPSATVEVHADNTSSGPLIMLEVLAPSPSSALKARTDVLATASAELARLQNEVGAPEALRMSPLTLAADAEPTAVNKNRLRAVAAVLAVGTGITVVGSCALDGLMLARAARAEKRSNNEFGVSLPQPAPRAGEIDDKVLGGRVGVRDGR